MVKLMRAQSCLSYGDIKSLLDRVEMPEGFPVAEFDSDDVLHRALLICEDVESDSGLPEHTATAIDNGDAHLEGSRIDSQSPHSSSAPHLRAVN